MCTLACLQPSAPSPPRFPRYPASNCAPKSTLGACDQLCFQPTSPAVPSSESRLNLCFKFDSRSLRSTLHEIHVSVLAFLGIQPQTVLPNRPLEPQVDLASSNVLVSTSVGTTGDSRPFWGSHCEVLSRHLCSKLTYCSEAFVPVSAFVGTSGLTRPTRPLLLNYYFVMIVMH